MTDFVLHAQLAKDSFLVTELPLCSVRLINDANFPWLILVPRVANISEVIQLSTKEQQILWQESAMVSEVLTQLFTPDKLNLAALGNMVPQLHLHHVVRYQNDVCWPKPIWGQVSAKGYSTDAAERRITQIQSAIN